MKIGFAGMTHLGIYSAVAAMERGFEIETEEFNACDIVYITQDIMTDANHVINPAQIVALFKKVDKAVAPSVPIVILSQVPVGFCRKLNRENVYLQVDTLRIKDALDRAINPEQIVIGIYNGTLPHESLKKYWKAFACPILFMTYESAEMVQKAININLAAQVSVTNTLSDICRELCADWADVVRALKNDKRIGEYAYLEPGNGLSGGHLERDIKSICTIGETRAINTNVVRSFLDYSNYRKAK